MKKLWLVGGLVVLALLLVACGATQEPKAQIIFESDRNSEGDVYVMDIEGSNVERLTDDDGWSGLPVWSPDGQRIAFASDRGQNFDVYVMDHDGANVMQLTRNAADNVTPSWSPDGKRIAFMSNREYKVTQGSQTIQVPNNSKIWVMNSDGTSVERYSRMLGLDMYPSWSPDGETLAYMSIRDGNGEIYVQGSDNIEVNLTDHPAADWVPVWSPDGSKILFMSDRDGNKEIYVMDADGSNPVNLTNHPANDGDPAWSLDGSKILFVSDRDGNSEVYMMNADGSEQTRLTDNPAKDAHPQWRPLPAQSED